MYVYMYVCMYMHVCIYVYMYVCMYIYICMCVCVLVFCLHHFTSLRLKEVTHTSEKCFKLFIYKIHILHHPKQTIK